MGKYMRVRTNDQPVKMFKKGHEPEASFARCEAETNENVTALDMPIMNFGAEKKTEQTTTTTNRVNGVTCLDLPTMVFTDATE